jgi:hypothetical protein
MIKRLCVNLLLVFMYQRENDQFERAQERLNHPEALSRWMNVRNQSSVSPRRLSLALVVNHQDGNRLPPLLGGTGTKWKNPLCSSREGAAGGLDPVDNVRVFHSGL